MTLLTQYFQNSREKELLTFFEKFISNIIYLKTSISQGILCEQNCETNNKITKQITIKHDTVTILLL